MGIDPTNQQQTKVQPMTKIIVANWKMNGSKSFIDQFSKDYVANSKNKTIFCPPFVYLNNLALLGLQIGGQDCSAEKSGAFTGEISCSMLKEAGCSHVIIGHSERRQYHNEDNRLIKSKAEQAITHGLTPIICVGEPQETRQAGNQINFVLHQLSQSVPHAQGSYYIAYEPIWAIGTGLTATESDIATMHAAIRQSLDKKVTPILYGGSVNKDNSHAILSIPDVDGVLVGGASLKVQDFNHIVAF